MGLGVRKDIALLVRMAIPLERGDLGDNWIERTGRIGAGIKTDKLLLCLGPCELDSVQARRTKGGTYENGFSSPAPCFNRRVCQQTMDHRSPPLC